MEEIDFKNVITAAELVRRQWRPHGWLLWQMVPQGGITLLAGETASGKTFLGLDLALGVASGRGIAWDMDLWEMEKSAQPLILSPLPGEGRRSRGEGEGCPSRPSSTASGPHLPWLAMGSPKGKAEGQQDQELFSPIASGGSLRNDTLPRVPSVSLRSQVADPPSRESYVGLPQVADPCSEAKGSEAGSRRETDGRLKRGTYEPSSIANDESLSPPSVYRPET